MWVERISRDREVIEVLRLLKRKRGEIRLFPWCSSDYCQKQENTGCSIGLDVSTAENRRNQAVTLEYR